MCVSLSNVCVCCKINERRSGAKEAFTLYTKKCIKIYIKTKRIFLSLADFSIPFLSLSQIFQILFLPFQFFLLFCCCYCCCWLLLYINEWKKEKEKNGKEKKIFSIYKINWKKQGAEQSRATTHSILWCKKILCIPLKMKKEEGEGRVVWWIVINVRTTGVEEILLHKIREKKPNTT